MNQDTQSNYLESVYKVLWLRYASLSADRLVQKILDYTSKPVCRPLGLPDVKILRVTTTVVDEGGLGISEV